MFDSYCVVDDDGGGDTDEGDGGDDGDVVLLCRYKRDSLKVLGTVGEPINPEAWHWYYSVVGEKKCPIVDTFWQTETVRRSP